MSEWMSADDRRNKILFDILNKQQNMLNIINEFLEKNTRALTLLNDQLYMMRREHEEHKEEICSAITMLGIKSPNSSEYMDDVDQPAVGFTTDHRKFSTSEGFTQTPNDYEGAVRDEEDNDTEV